MSTRGRVCRVVLCAPCTRRQAIARWPSLSAQVQVCARSFARYTCRATILSTFLCAILRAMHKIHCISNKIHIIVPRALPCVNRDLQRLDCTEPWCRQEQQSNNDWCTSRAPQDTWRAQNIGFALDCMVIALTMRAKIHDTRRIQCANARTRAAQTTHTYHRILGRGSAHLGAAARHKLAPRGRQMERASAICK